MTKIIKLEDLIDVNGGQLKVIGDGNKESASLEKFFNDVETELKKDPSLLVVYLKRQQTGVYSNQIYIPAADFKNQLKGPFIYQLELGIQ